MTQTASPAPAGAATPSLAEAETRQRLLHSAITLFDRKGYAATSVREIVETPA